MSDDRVLLCRRVASGEHFDGVSGAALPYGWRQVGDEMQLILPAEGFRQLPQFDRRRSQRRAMELDALSDQLLAIAAAFHSQRRSLGLLCPKNLLYCPPRETGGAPKLVLLDAGWTLGGGLLKPKWVADSAHDEWRWIWESDADAIDRRVRRGWSEEIEADDVRLLAKLLRWCATGRRDGDAGEPAAFAGLAVLRDAERGRISTVKELRSGLAASPLGECVTRRSGPLRNVLRAPWAGPALALVMAASLALGAWQTALPEVAPHFLSPEVPGDPAWNALLDEFDGAAASLEEREKTLKRLADAAQVGRDSVRPLRRRVAEAAAVSFAAQLDAETEALWAEMAAGGPDDLNRYGPMMKRLTAFYETAAGIAGDCWPEGETRRCFRRLQSYSAYWQQR